MTVTLLASASPASATTHDLAVTLTAGGTALAGIRTGSSTTVTVAFSDGTHAFTALGPFDNGAGRQYLFYLQNAPGGAATIRYTLSAAGAPRLAVAEIPNATATSFDVASAGNSGTGLNLTGGATATTAQANEEAVGLFSSAANETYAQNGSWPIVGVEPAAGSSRLAITHQTLSAIGTPNAAVDENASAAWIGVTATFRITSSGLSTGTQTASIGMRAANTSTKASSSTSTSSFGTRDTNVTTKVSFNFNASGVGFRETNATTRTIGSNGGRPSVGFRATNTTVLGGINSQARFGFRDTNVSSKTTTNISAARVGFRDANVASKTTINLNSASVGVRATNTSNLSGGSRTSFGYRAANQTTRTIAVGTATSRMGARAVNSTVRTINSATAAAKVGFRATNITFLGGTPIVVTPNFEECETDLTLPREVVWA
jgi:hypothetical protein